MTYRAAPVSQRDGSALANSNCRPASIATGIDYDTGGGIVSSGATMRGRMSDQSGGTSSSDAVEAWSSYGRKLTVRDGRTWADALNDLEAGRLVHIDVWHAAAGGPCLSGSGGYGHTMAVGPEFRNLDVLVADPWCSPGKWVWWPIERLQRGAEEWGRRVYAKATGGAPPVSRWEGELLRRILKAARELLDEHYPGHESDEPAPPETGGSQPILYTATAAREVGPMTLQYDILEGFAGTVEVEGSGHSYLDLTTGKLHGIGAGIDKDAYALIRVQTGTVLGDEPDRRTGYLIGTSAAMLLESDVIPHPSSGGGGGDGETPDEAYARGRSDEWGAWADGLGIPDPPG